MKNKNAALSYIFFVLAIIFSFSTIIHSLFPKININIKLSSKLFFAQFYAFPIVFGFIFLVIGILFLTVILIRKKETPLKIITWSIVIISSIIFIFFGHENRENKEVNSDKSFKIVEWNAQDNFNQEAVKKIFGDFDTDIAVFPEYYGDITSATLKEYFSNTGLNLDDYEVFVSDTKHYGIAPVTIITKKSFGDFEKEEINIENQVTFGTIKVESGDIEIIGIHTAPPLPSLMDYWNSDLKLISDITSKENPNAILVGDFNATLRHSYMNNLDGYFDSVSYLDNYSRGTWPQNIPSYLKSSIDHILAKKDKYFVKFTEIVNINGSDHSAIFSILGIK